MPGYRRERYILMENEATPATGNTVAEWPKNKKETLLVSLTEYNGNQLIDIRAYYPAAGGEMKAGKGISLQRSQIGLLKKALIQAEKLIKCDGGPASE